VSKHLERDLERLGRSVSQMGGAVEQAIYKSTTALRGRNQTLARQVIVGDAEVDRLENEVQDECLKILALHQPVAVDLRRVTAILLISTDLERMGDLAVGIAERAVSLPRANVPPLPARFTDMTERVTGMVRRALDAYVNLDAAAARGVIRTDDETDRDNEAIIAGLIDDMKAHPDRIDTGLSLFSAVRNLERIADHATNIAEGVIFLVEGAVVRHRPEADAPAQSSRPSA
jgi:phosphate transport system protein